MYKRKKHREPLHHHRTPAETAEQERVDAENATASKSTPGPTSFFGKLLARLQSVPGVQRAETILRERVLETPAGRVARSALGYAAKGKLFQALSAVRRGAPEPEEERTSQGASSDSNRHAVAA